MCGNFIMTLCICTISSVYSIIMQCIFTMAILIKNIIFWSSSVLHRLSTMIRISIVLRPLGVATFNILLLMYQLDEDVKDKNSIRDGGRTALCTAYTVDTSDTVDCYDY